ncbi:alpha/beta hydrolase-fold protein [Actinomycetospora chlora]|uniref:Alpha/beta hydrolase-fold protein n=1 Tax=Actinomycetospora chlora TaxID=663608 RepID=A0ABP9CAA1_9PSEU
MPPRAYSHSPSLLSGWLPWTVQALVLLVLLLAVGWRTAPFRRRRLPVVLALGAAGAVAAWWSFRDSGLASDPAPLLLWVWVGLTVAAAVLVVAGWPGARWWRRTLAVLAVPLCLLAVGVVLNQWVGYVPTVAQGWSAATAGPLPDQVAPGQLAALRGHPQATGHLVEVSIPSAASGFPHRDEDVWLPPAWFTGTTPLPVVVMIGGEFNTPADWARIGDAIPVADGYAAAHGGVAPILVFVDAGGTFNNDTECVDGPRGAAADHLTRDVVPFVEQRFGASSDPRQWGVVGWSMGGTCAVDLAVMHPELVDSFVDIAGDAGPEVGTRDQTIDRLYGGDAAAWARFDPATVLAGHAPYADTAGRFVDSSDGPTRHGPARPGAPPAADPAAGLGGRGGGGATGQELPEARALCAQARTRGIACTVDTRPGRHSWPFASSAFADALPWLAGRLEAPGSAAAA